MKKIILLILTIMPPRSALSADLCRAIALRDVAAIENPDSILKRGDYVIEISQHRINKHTGMASFCSHGGYCYPTHVVLNGKKMEALKLTNCKISKKSHYEDPDDIYLFRSVDVDRSKNTSADLRRYDLDNKFLDMGLCSACAGNVTTFYIEKPSSPCSKLAKQALKGDAGALEELKGFPSYCRWE